MIKSYYFLSGLPRTGSTLLASLLNQHPNVHASGTSALLELLLSLSNAVQFNRTWYEITPSQEIQTYSGIIDSYYKHINKKFIFDKHRLWPKFIDPLSRMGINAKIICTYRPVPEIISSYISLIDRNPSYPNLIDDFIIKKNLPITTQNRAITIWEEYIKIPHDTLKSALKENNGHLFVVTYDDIVNNPLNTLNKISKFFELEPFDKYKFDNITNVEPEKDDGWRIKELHTIRPELKKISIPPERVIGGVLTEYFSQYNLTK